VKTAIYRAIFILLVLSGFYFTFGNFRNEIPSSLSELPVFYKGRYCPLEVMAREWLFQKYNRETFLEKHRVEGKLSTNSAVEFFWKIHQRGSEPWTDFPLFCIDDLSLKQALKLDLQKSHFSVLELKEYFHPQTIYRTLESLDPSSMNRFLKLYSEIREFELPSSFLKLIPYYNEKSSSLWESYRLASSGKGDSYPTSGQLKAEIVHHRLPLQWAAIFSFAIAAFVSLFPKKLSSLAMLSSILGFVFLTLLIILRCYILHRPPVTNLYETFLYIPWVISFFSLFFYKRVKDSIFLALILAGNALLISAPLFLGLSDELTLLPPILNTPFWLSTHVLIICASYGAFLIAAVLGHFYLFKTQEIESMKLLFNLILVGTALLIAGTLLGGVWAMQSWGRFWGWDPKECWAFISIFFYLVVIHGHYLRRLSPTQLALGASLGFIAITFNWYGVNYILGKGLHSYGFAKGDSFFYLLGISCDLLLLLGLFIFKKRYEIKKKVKDEDVAFGP
jgi:ABC-type transport system involved in cytochrome c biogenesis permease subunit